MKGTQVVANPRPGPRAIGTPDTIVQTGKDTPGSFACGTAREHVGLHTLEAHVAVAVDALALGISTGDPTEVATRTDGHFTDVTRPQAELITRFV
jgi:hypothetical protein